MYHDTRKAIWKHSAYQTKVLNILTSMWSAPMSNNCSYCSTCADRYSRWIEAISITDITAETVVNALLIGWISYFRVAEFVTTEQCRQFENNLFNHLPKMLAIKHIRTTPYHSQANGLLERWHRIIKQRWKVTMPIPIGLRCFLLFCWV